MLDREKYMQKMREQLLVVNSGIYEEARKQLEALIEY